MEIKYGKNPLTRLDYPDPDVIRVGDTYYMCSTTMYFMPGCVILRSFDLINWEFCCHVYDELEDTENQRLDGKTAYGKGMWASTIRYHDGIFHVVFIANDTGKTYHYTSSDIMGPWKKSYIDGFYHDSSLLFDDDGKVYIMYGNRKIWVTELKPDLSGPMPGGVHKLVIEDTPGPHLGYEGTHLYKINGKYYAFFIHAARDKWMRIEAAYMSDRIDGGWTGKDVIAEYFDGTTGVAQGGIVDTPSGKWYGVIFGDRGAVGRIPNLVPMHFDETGFPVFEQVTKEISCESTRPEHVYKPLYVSSEFTEPLDGAWEWNHIPDLSRIKIGDGLTVAPLHAESFEMAKNTLTQRALWQKCSAEVTVCAENLGNGGFAGLAALQYRYGALGIERSADGFHAVLKLRDDGSEYEAVRIKCSGTETFRVHYEFGAGKDYAEFYILTDDGWKQLGDKHRMTFDLRHFTGCRFGLFCYTTGAPEGSAVFRHFVYDDCE